LIMTNRVRRTRCSRPHPLRAYCEDSPIVVNWLDLATQQWVRATGSRVDISTDYWLRGSIGGTDRIAASWLADEAARQDAVVDTDSEVVGLLASLSALDGKRFSAAALAPAVRDFYEQTSRWRLEASVIWSPWAWPWGWLLST